MKRRQVLWPLLLATALMALAQISGRPSQQQKPADTTLRDDTYAVYSAMLADPVTVYFVQGATVPLQGPPPPQICLPPTATNQADWRELLAELNQYKFSPETLSATFKTAKPVILLDDMEIAEFRLRFAGNFRKTLNCRGPRILPIDTRIF